MGRRSNCVCTTIDIHTIDIGKMRLKISNWSAAFVEELYNYIRGLLAAVVTAVMAYIDSTIAFMAALAIAFTFNILAGMKADEVKIRIKRLWPPDYFENFDGNKFKDSLMELTMIVGLIYMLKGMADFMGITDSSIFIVQYLTWVALYVYVRNGLRNMTKAYPRIKFFKIVYAVIAFKFKDFISPELAEEIEKIEKEE